MFPFPVMGIGSDNGSKFINAHLLAYGEQEELTFTRSRAGNKNDGCQAEHSCGNEDPHAGILT